LQKYGKLSKLKDGKVGKFEKTRNRERHVDKTVWCSHMAGVGWGGGSTNNV